MRSRSKSNHRALRLAALLLAATKIFFGGEGDNTMTATSVEACTDLLVTPGASKDGSAMIAYNADSPTLYGSLYHYPAMNANDTTSTKKATAMRKIYDWDTGVYRGEIEEYDGSTYNVVGNGNSVGLVIGESTFGGVDVLAKYQEGAIMDYGSLIYVTLQRASTARQAIQTMADLVDEYGYASEGESFSLADSTTGEVWMMELIGTGNTYSRKGAVWVAQRIPDGTIAAHANHARITTFDRNDPGNCMYAKDVVEVAVHYGLYGVDADPAQFSFSDVYDPLNFVNARQGEARVWSIFGAVADTTGDFARQYEPYALGHRLETRMPLYIEPHSKLSVLDVMRLMNSNYERTSLDSSKDVGAGLFATPHRPRPLVWEYNRTKYHNERSISTPKTGWNFVAQLRPEMPPPLSVLIYFAVDDSATSPRTPIYACSTEISPAYAGKGSQDGVVTPILQFDLKKAFVVQNMVSNFAYYRWRDVYPTLRAKIDGIQKDFVEKVVAIDRKALELYNTKGQAAAVRYATRFSVDTADALHEDWLEFYGYLFVRYRDYYTITPQPDEPVCNCRAKEPGLSDSTKERIVSETGNRYKVPVSVTPATENGGGGGEDEGDHEVAGEGTFHTATSRM